MVRRGKTKAQRYKTASAIKIATGACPRLKALIPIKKPDSSNLILMITWQIYINSTVLGGGPRWRSWLRHCAKSQKVAGSILDGVIGIFH